MLDPESLSSVDEEVGASQYEDEMLKFRKTLFSKANTNIKKMPRIVKRGTMTENTIAKWSVYFQIWPANYVSRLKCILS